MLQNLKSFYIYIPFIVFYISYIPADAQKKMSKKRIVNSVALIQVMVGEPSIQFESQDSVEVSGNKIPYLDFFRVQQSHAPLVFRNFLANEFSRQFRINVVYGEDMVQDESYIELGKQYNKNDFLATKNSKFPYIQLGPGEFNYFRFYEGSVYHYFKRNKFNIELNERIAEVLGTDLIIVSFSQIVEGDNYLLYKDPFHKLYTSIYIFNHKGTFLKGLNQKSKNFRWNSRTPDSLHAIYDQFYPMNRELINKIPKYLTNHIFNNGFDTE